MEGFLLAPGYIDLSQLQFVAVTPEVVSYDYGSAMNNLADDDDVYDTASATNNGEIKGEDEDGGNRRRQQQQQQRQLNEEDYYMEGSALDIAVFNLPESCASTRTGCDWTKLGIGKRSEDGKELRYCCTAEAVSIGLCRGMMKGRLIMDPEKFQGKVRTEGQLS